jgi:hypothetical protein
MNRSKCMDCCESTPLLYEDPRVPPLDIEPCLCRDCALGNLDEVIEDRLAEIESLRGEVARIENSATPEGVQE